MGKYMAKVVCLGLMLLMSGLTLVGEEWTIYGPRAQGMGGAGVAVGDAATSPYWNPAALALKDSKGLYIPIGTTISAEGDILKYVDAVFDAINSMDWETISADMEAGTLSPAQVQQLLNLYVNSIPKMEEPGQGLLLNLNGGTIVTIGNIGISGNFLGYAGIDPVVDFQTMNLSDGGIADIVGPGPYYDYSPGSTGDNLAGEIAGSGWGWTKPQAEELIWLAQQAEADISDPLVQEYIKTIAQTTGGGLTLATENESGIIMSGIALKEIGISYGQPVLDEFLSVGGTLKMMEGETFYKFIRFDEMQSGDDIVDDLGDKHNRKTSTSLGLDIGALLCLTDNLKVGLTGRNLNKPKFRYAGSGDYELDPQYRLGASLKLTNMLLLAADYDLTKNESTVLDGYESQMAGVGAEINLISFLKLRVGAYDNIASDEADPVYTAGAGVHLLWLDFDLAGAISTGEVEIETGAGDTSKINECYSVALSFALRF